MRKLRRFMPLLVAAAVLVAGGTGAAAAVGATTQAAHAGGQPAHMSAARLGAAAPASPVTPRVACGQLATVAYDFSNVPDAPTYILSAAEITYNSAAYCEVTAYIAPQEQFDLKLPVSSYTGDYVQEGCGGYCGSGTAGTPAVATSCPKVTGNELAIATDNQGHVGGGTDALWAGEDPQLRVAFGYSAEHALAQAAKSIIAAYYGSPPSYSYFDGCSDGGHEALVDAQRYPKDFNGILAGAPANIWTQLLGEFQNWIIAVNMNSRGHEILGSEDLPALHAAVVKACGNAQGVIADPRSCDFNPASIQCPAGVQSTSCLTPAQVKVAADLYLGPNDGHGHYLYPGGEPYGSELAWAGWLIGPLTDAQWPLDTAGYQFGINYLKYSAYWHNPPSTLQLRDFKFNLQEYDRLLPLAGIYNGTDPDLSAFRRDGGKLIIWQGWADQAISPFGTVDYYKALVQQAGGFTATQAFSRLYMVPGGYHCLGGGSPAVTADFLDPLMSWVENGVAPGTLTFPLVAPTATLTALSVQPLNPLSPPAGGVRGLNTQYRWVGTFQSGGEQWCSTEEMSLVCSLRRPPISYAVDTNTKASA